MARWCFISPTNHTGKEPAAAIRCRLHAISAASSAASVAFVISMAVVGGTWSTP